MPDWMGDGDIAFPFLGIYLENVPKTFTVFGITIALYGLIIGIGMILAFVLITHVAKKNGLDPDDFYDMGMWLIIFGIIGARIYYVIFSWDYYKNNLGEIINLRQGGLAIYGGVIAGFTALIVWCRVKKKSICKMGDVAFMGVLVGQIMGRWGNFTNREVFGGYCDNIFAMRLPISAVRSRDISEELASHIVDGTNYIQVHPTFLYESFYNLVLLSLIYIFFKKKAFDGEAILWYLGGYGIGRFIIEGIRTDRLLIPGTGLAVSQLLGISLFAISLAIDIIVRVKQKNGGEKSKQANA
ncbi:MAG: prolipoprotein diacylglyceryl transferase [Lachnospiraceae bacterium]|nr:prolipoprotein diacylglyceryl transferase [Lachnospiraceae bacterium]